MIRRIAELRKQEKLSQEQFAERLGLSRNFINQVETGKKNVSDRTIADICRVFNVNEQWLRTGEGEMFKEISQTEELEQIFAAIAVSDDCLIKRIIRAYWKLNDSEKAAMQKMIDNLLKETEQTAESPAPAIALPPSPAAPKLESGTLTPEEEARAEAEEYYRQILLEKRAAMSEASCELKIG